MLNGDELAARAINERHRAREGVVVSSEKIALGKRIERKSRKRLDKVLCA
jgi:hypothetical protein